MKHSDYRGQFIAYLARQIVKLLRSSTNGNLGRQPLFRTDENGTIHFPLRFRGRLLRLNSGETALTAETPDDLIAQLEQLKEVAVIGGLDSILDAAMNSSE